MMLHVLQMQRLVKAAKDGTKDGLQKTKAAVRKGRSFIRTRSLCYGKSANSTTSNVMNSQRIVILINMPLLFNLFHESIILYSEKKPSCFDEESDLFIEVECFNVDPVLRPAPDGLSQHQVLFTNV